MAKKKQTTCTQTAPVSAIPVSHFDGGLLGMIGTGVLSFLAFLGGLILPLIAAGAILYLFTPLDVQNLQSINVQDFITGKTLLFTAAAGVVLLFGLFFAIAWAVTVYLRWEIRHTSVNGKRLKFKGGAWSLFGNMIKWFFLTIITIGIYGLWLPVKTKKWVVSKTVMEDPTPAPAPVAQQPSFNAAAPIMPAMPPVSNPFLPQPMQATPVMPPFAFPTVPYNCPIATNYSQFNQGK